MNAFVEVAIEAAREAGGILMTEFDRPVKISYKGEVDIVTQADRRSEQAIVTRLRTRFPKHAIVAAEGGGAESDSPFRWQVDPLDGHTHFAHAYPFFPGPIGLEAWASAAGVLLVREGGGTVTRFDGEPYGLGDRELLASNGRVHAEMKQITADIAERSATQASL